MLAAVMSTCDRDLLIVTALLILAFASAVKNKGR